MQHFEISFVPFSLNTTQNPPKINSSLPLQFAIREKVQKFKGYKYFCKVLQNLQALDQFMLILL